MKLAPMQYKDYIWPHNPRVYSIEFRRQVAAHKVPQGRYSLQSLGMTHRIMRGEGEFQGPEAYQEFKKLASVFYQEGPGSLIHPIWQSSRAHFVELTLLQEPRQDYLRYRFAFWEDYEGFSKTLTPVVTQTASAASTASTASATSAPQATNAAQQYYTVVRGDSLWRIASAFGLSLAELLALNPQIKNPNLIYPEDRVRVR